MKKTICLCEEDILNEILIFEKNLSNNYSIMLNEMSNKYLYKKVLSIFTETKNITKEIFYLMNELGYYVLIKEDEEKVESSCEKYKAKMKELS